MRPQIACRPCSPRAWSSSEQEARVRKKSLAGEANGGQQAPGTVPRRSVKRRVPTNPQGPAASGSLAAASAFLVTRIALGIVGIGFFGRIWMLLSAGFLFGLVLGLTWIHRFAHGSLLLGAQSQRFTGCRRGISVRMLWVMANCSADPAVIWAMIACTFLGCRQWLGLHLKVNGSLAPSRQACQVRASRR